MNAPKVRRKTLIRELRLVGYWQEPRMRNALQLAIEHHGGVRRDLGAFVLNQHLFPFALSVLQELNAPRETRIVAVASALLHDSTEDTQLTVGVIREHCGILVAHYVAALDRTEKSDEVYFAAIMLDPLLAFLKCMDRFNNLLGMGSFRDRARVRRFCKETEIYVIPIAACHCPQLLPRIRRQLDLLQEVPRYV